jgi:dihydroorotate dehydrogenase
MYRLLYRNFFMHFDAEFIHDVVAGGLGLAGSIPPTRALIGALCAPPTEGMALRALGLNFEHPLGMAGGFDKEGTCLHGIGALGFSHVEVGTVTPRPQPGNPRPRIVRLAEDEAFVNRMGFPSRGMAAVRRNLSRLRGHRRPIAISLGKNKETTLPDAHKDYSDVLSVLYPYGDFFVINVSSPNTLELRKLQAREYLAGLLAALRETLAGLDRQPKPLLIKIAPDLSFDEIDSVLEVALAHGVSGIVATNSTLNRDNLRSRNRDETGGLSGRPLREHSTEIIRHIYCRTEGKLCIIGVGGVFTGDDVWEKMQAGATLVQAYTGFIYEGPAFVRKCLRRVRQRMGQESVHCLCDIIGTGA